MAKVVQVKRWLLGFKFPSTSFKLRGREWFYSRKKTSRKMVHKITFDGQGGLIIRLFSISGSPWLYHGNRAVAGIPFTFSRLKLWGSNQLSPLTGQRKCKDMLEM